MQAVAAKSSEGWKWVFFFPGDDMRQADGCCRALQLCEENRFDGDCDLTAGERNQRCKVAREKVVSIQR